MTTSSISNPPPSFDNSPVSTSPSGSPPKIPSNLIDAKAVPFNKTTVHRTEYGYETHHEFSWEVLEATCIERVASYLQTTGTDVNFTPDDYYSTSCYEQRKQVDLGCNETTILFFNSLIQKFRPFRAIEEFDKFYTWEVFADILQSVEENILKSFGGFIPWLNSRSREIKAHLKDVQAEFDERVEKSVEYLLDKDWSAAGSCPNAEPHIINAMAGLISYFRYRLAHANKELSNKIFEIPEKWFIDTLSSRVEVGIREEFRWDENNNRYKESIPYREIYNDIDFFVWKNDCIQELTQRKVNEIANELVSKSLDEGFGRSTGPALTCRVVAEEAQQSSLSKQLCGSFQLMDYTNEDGSDCEAANEDGSDCEAAEDMPFVRKFFFHVYSLFCEERQKRYLNENFVDVLDNFIERWKEEALFLNGCEEAINIFFKKYHKNVLKEMELKISQRIKEFGPIPLLELTILKQKIKYFKEQSEKLSVSPFMLDYMERLVFRIKTAYSIQLNDIAYRNGANYHAIGSCFEELYNIKIFAYFLKNSYVFVEERLKNINPTSGYNSSDSSSFEGSPP